MITTPKLPPRAGYVEVDDDAGGRTYKKVESAENHEFKTSIALLSSQIQATSERSDFIEDCVAEMAMQVYTQ